MFDFQKPINTWKTSTLALVFFLLISAIAGAILLLANNDSQISNKSNPESESISFFLVKPASAQEIYPLFECPCCGKAIDQCTCPMAKERRNYVDALVEIGNDKSKDDIIIAYTKKYGLSSFIDEETQKEFRDKLIKEAPADRPIISLSPNSYDFGDVSWDGGVATTLFELRNEGKSNLIIEKLETSCGCTSVSIIHNGQEGPKFNMPGHGINEKIQDWQITITPGEEAQLKVYYDPNVHQDFRGTAIRGISIFSNDPIDFEKKVNIELNQVD